MCIKEMIEAYVFRGVVKVADYSMLYSSVSQPVGWYPNVCHQASESRSQASPP